MKKLTYFLVLFFGLVVMNQTAWADGNSPVERPIPPPPPSPPAPPPPTLIPPTDWGGGGGVYVPLSTLGQFSMNNNDNMNVFAGLARNPESSTKPNGIVFESPVAITSTRTTAMKALNGFVQIVKNYNDNKKTRGDTVSLLEEFKASGPLYASLDLPSKVDTSFLNEKLMEELDLKSSDYILSIAVLSFALLDPEQRVSLSWAVARAIRFSNDFYKSLFERLHDLSSSNDPKMKEKTKAMMAVLKNADLIRVRNWVSYLSQHTVIEKEYTDEKNNEKAETK